jgi:hypothetical protein
VTEHRRLADTNELRSAGALSEDAHDAKEREEDPLLKEVRVTDLEPYTGLRYLSKLFRFMAVIMLLLLVAEVATGVYTQGSAALPTLLGEASRLIVIAGVLWGTGDLAHLLIDVGHDVRAARILVARVAHQGRSPAPVADRARGVERASTERMLPRPAVVDLADRDGSGGRGGK